MARRCTAFELVLAERRRGTPAVRWLYEAMRGEIVRGRLRPGTRIPATRDLARQYGLSRGTIVNSFDQLKSEGYLKSIVGSGTFVSHELPDDLLEVANKVYERPSEPVSRERRLSDFGRRVSAFPNFGNRPTRAFRANLPALNLFPATLWAQVAARRMRRVGMSQLLGCDAMGYVPLRKAIAEYLGSSRGVHCEAEQVAVVSGTQEALDLAARLLLNRGDRVGMEEPGYTGAAAVFEAAGARIVGARVDEEGMRLEERSLRGVRLVYMTPGHQFPLGITMSLARRLQWLDWAARSGAAILEDDYDSEFRYVGRPVPALQGMDRCNQVLFMGSFNKVLFPSLRLGYLVVPPDMTEALSATLSITKRHAPMLDQTVLCEFITSGHFGRHLRRMRKVYAERLQVLRECAEERLGGALKFTGVEAGLQTAAWLGGGLDAERVATAAAKREVEAEPLTPYWRGRPEREGLLLGFAAMDAREIRRGVRELAIAIEELAGLPARRPPVDTAKVQPEPSRSALTEWRNDD